MLVFQLTYIVYFCQPGDRIKVLKEIDSSWLECELNGKVGRCPAPFVMVEAVAPEVEDTDPEEVRKF